VPLARPDNPDNVTLYRFVFPDDNATSDAGDAASDKFKYHWIEEKVIVDAAGIPKECTAHVEKVRAFDRSIFHLWKSLYLWKKFYIHIYLFK
jgi:hypothetical protein